MTTQQQTTKEVFLPPCSWRSVLTLNPNVPGIKALRAYDGHWFHCKRDEVSEAAYFYKELHPRRARALFGEPTFAKTAGVALLWYILANTLRQSESTWKPVFPTMEQDVPLINLMTPILARILTAKLARGDNGLTAKDYVGLYHIVEKADGLPWLSSVAKETLPSLKKTLLGRFIETCGGPR